MTTGPWLPLTTVSSHSNPEKTYEISVRKNTDFTNGIEHGCTCPAWRYKCGAGRKAANRTGNEALARRWCKHIRQVQAAARDPCPLKDKFLELQHIALTVEA